jgi:hypothetical protein
MADNGKVVATKELRIFGCGAGIIMALLGALLVWRGMARVPVSELRVFAGQIIGTCGVVFLLFGILMPKLLTPVYRWWMPKAERIGEFNTQVLLFLVFWLVFGPVAILRRLLGADDLRLKDVPRDSYFVPKKQVPVTLETCRHQF